MIGMNLSDAQVEAQCQIEVLGASRSVSLGKGEEGPVSRGRKEHME